MVSTSLTSYYTPSYSESVVCCGRRVPATVEAVQSVMTSRGLTAARQATEWLEVARSYADPQWMATCIERAEAMASLVEREEAVRRVLQACEHSAHSTPPALPDINAPAERQFEWLGEPRGTTLSVLRDGIAAIATAGFICRDADQQAALRRALGVVVNATEASSRGPWVRWLGETDALNYLVESLWQMGLIYCPGGRRHKWQTLCGAFLRADGRRIEPSIKNNRCTNTHKRESIDHAILNGLRFVSPLKAR